MTTTTPETPPRSRAHTVAMLTRRQRLELARQLASRATPTMLRNLVMTLPDDTLTLACLVLEEDVNERANSDALR
jgi:hypothetical protein